MFKNVGSLTSLFVLATTTLVTGAGLPLGISSVDTEGLPATGDEWLTENPYRADAAGEDIWLRAVEVGASGYNQNCARCHGLEGISGGLAPDLRLLEASEYDDEWFIERFRAGYTQSGVTRMPAFGEVLTQEAAWAIRTYVEARPDDQMIAELTPALSEIRDELAALATDTAGANPDDIKARLSGIAGNITTLSTAPVADSVAFRAARLIDGTPSAYAAAAEALTIGLSAAK